MKHFFKIVFFFFSLLTSSLSAQLSADFMYLEACQDAPVQMSYTVDSSNDSIVAYDWDFNNDNQYSEASGKQCAHVFSGNGFFSVGLRIISVFNDTAYARKNIYVSALPIANFTVQEVCQNELIHTTNTTQVNGADIKYYKWTFDGGNTVLDSLGNTPSFFFNTEGSHDIMLQAITVSGCTASVHKNVMVNPIPVSDFIINDNCIGDTSLFKAVSTINSGSIVQYQWDFNSDAVFNDASGSNAEYAFFATGNWQISLRTISAKGCKHDTLKSIAVYPRPHAQFLVNNTCVKTNVDLENLSFTDFGALHATWTFANKDTSSQWEPIYQFIQAGTYNIKLKVNSVFSCADSIEKTITVSSLPKVDFSAANVCLNNALICNNNSSAVDGIKNYSWNFGDGWGTVSQHPSHKYSAAGNYDVTLTAESNKGCLDSLTKNIQIYSVPNAHIFPSATTLCKGDSAMLVGLNLVGKTYVWSTSSTADKIYVKDAGEYELTLFDANNCWAKDSVEIIFNDVPKFNNSKDTSITLGSPLSLWADGFYDFKWLDEQNNIVNQKQDFNLIPFESQLYSVTATNEKNCSTTHYIKVDVLKDYHLVANDIITPNNDGKNDVWKINYITVYPYFKLSHLRHGRMNLRCNAVYVI